MDIKLPAPAFDMGSFQIDNDQVMLYGGFNDGATKQVWFYKTHVSDQGEFQEGQDLQDNDFFVQNGVFLRLSNRQLIFPGHKFMHLYNPDCKSFATLKNFE
jgi:hypothetical protein